MDKEQLTNFSYYLNSKNYVSFCTEVLPGQTFEAIW